ncbi:hypothetical protein LZ554_003473 [Drepanopeziza brunnea f. sp. 'monogermtubi']|nr:hypothetical protein LZ554_003473 [Drepanopeziza brunnea f. sp. 'monogermtubi']
MIFINTIYAALLAASAVTAAPSALTPRQLASVVIKLCKDVNFYGCENVPITLNQCVNVPRELVDSVSSLDTYDHTCTFYDDGNCSAIPGLSPSAIFRGVADDVTKYPAIASLNDVISSMKCV